MNDKSGKLQDIESWIKMVEDEKYKGKIYFWFNRIAVPSMFNKSTDEWLKILYFLRKQEEQNINFFNDLKKEKNKYVKAK